MSINSSNMQNKSGIIYSEKRNIQFLIAVIAIVSILFFFYDWTPFFESDSGVEWYRPESVMVIVATFLVLVVTYLSFPRTTLVLKKSGFTYTRGRVSWEADWNDVVSLKRVGGAIMIQTNNGWTKPVELASLREENSDKKFFIRIFGINVFRLAYFLQNPNTVMTQKFTSQLESLSGKKIVTYHLNKNERYRV